MDSDLPYNRSLNVHTHRCYSNMNAPFDNSTLHHSNNNSFVETFQNHMNFHICLGLKDIKIWHINEADVSLMSYDASLCNIFRSVSK